MKSLIFAVYIMLSGAVYAATATVTTSCPSGTVQVALPFLFYGDRCPGDCQSVYYNGYTYGDILGIEKGTYSDSTGTFYMDGFCPLTE